MSSFFPDWVADYRVSDELFSRSYEAMPGERRAWVKKTAARLHALLGGMTDPSTSVRTEHRQGFVSLENSVRNLCAVLFLDNTCTSASKVAAAAVPMVLSGIQDVCAVRVGDAPPEPDEVFAALELSGVETVVHLDDAGARAFAENLSDGCSASVLFQGHGEALQSLAVACGYASPPLRLWKPFLHDRIAVWAGDGVEWDYQTLAWANPCVKIDLYGEHGAIANLPQTFYRREGGFGAVLNEGYQVLYLPEERISSAQDMAQLVLGPGHEGCWVWPDLQPCFFQRRKLAIHSATV